MSTDYSAACFTCRRYHHLGVRFSSGWAFGHGSRDLMGHRRAGDWLLEHLHQAHDVRVLDDDAVPDDFVADDQPPVDPPV